MKVVFLDLDGVLNSRIYDRTRNFDELTYIDETRMPLLKQIIERTNAVIVFSSTWRSDWEKDCVRRKADGNYIVETFEKFGLEIYDKTPDLGFSASRADEIRAWLNEHGKDVSAYVIIDDCNDDWREMREHVVKTSAYIGRGLEEIHVMRAIEILGAAEE